MLHLKEGVNQIFATLAERASVASLFFEMTLKPQDERTTEKTIRLIDLTAPGDRVNKLQVEVVTDQSAENLNESIVCLIGGSYIYEIKDSTGKECEKGVLDVDISTKSIEYTNETKEIVYNG